MKIKFDGILTAFKIALGVFTHLVKEKHEGKVEKVAKAIEVTETVADLIKPPKSKPKAKKKASK